MSAGFEIVLTIVGTVALVGGLGIVRLTDKRRGTLHWIGRLLFDIAVIIIGIYSAAIIWKIVFMAA